MNVFQPIEASCRAISSERRHIDRRLDLVAAGRARQHHAEQPDIMHPLQQARQESAACARSRRPRQQSPAPTRGRVRPDRCGSGCSCATSRRTYHAADRPGAVKPLIGSLLSLDHIVGPRQQRGWNDQVERLRGFQIDDQLEFGRRLHRQVGRLRALENPIDIGCRSPHLIGQVDAVTHQAAFVGKTRTG